MEGVFVLLMTDKEFENERIYQTIMIQAKNMLSQGIITEDEYVSFDTKMKAKYQPKFGILCGIN